MEANAVWNIFQCSNMEEKPHFTLDFTGRCAKTGTENKISIIFLRTSKILSFQMPRMHQKSELTTNGLQAPQELATKFAQALQAHPLAVEK